MSNQIVITSGAKLRDLDDVIIGTDGILSSVAFNVANGVPRLDENGKILVSQLPNSVMEFKGVWDAATNTPTLVNGTGSAGDVWLCNVAGTVNFGAGPIAFAVGDYAVYTGTVWARSSGATGTVTSVGVSRDGNALTITGSPVTSSGTINLGFSGDNTQYINGAGNLTTFPTLITSIGLTMPAAFNVSNSPLTANGTIGVSAAGYASQYIRGDGTLADFPTSGGGGSSVSYYFNGGTSQGTIGGTTYYEMSKTADTGTGVDFNKTGDGFIVAFLTDANDPNLLQIPAGNWDFEIYASMSSNGGTPELYAELYKYDGTTFTLIATSSHEILYDGVNLNLYSFATAVPQTSLTVTDRLAIKLYADNSGGKTTTIHTQDSHLCQVITTFSTGLTALNGLTAQVQYFGTGTSGNDFNIVSSVATHTFNIPSASATARGLITTGTQTIAGSKTITGTTTFTGGPILSDTNLTYANSGYTLVLQSPTLSVNRTVTLPNGTGTLALTSDISYPVTSVFGRTGAVVATSGDYTTTQVTEGTNLYFTDARARTAISLTTTGSTGASTYNNTTGVLNIPNYADQYVGTVTSVDMSVPTGLSVSGNPITTSGTLAVTLTAGYSIPTTANQSTWTTAYNRSLTSAAVTGTTTKTLTLNQQDGGTITASWTDINTDAVTSVFGRTGAVVATSGDYNTDQVTEGTTNLYFTNTRSRAAISLTTTGTSGAATYNNTTGVFNIPSYVGGVTSVFGRTGAVVATDGDYTLTLLGDVTITTPSSGQVLKYNGTAWINDTDANTGTVTSVAMTVPTGLSIAGSPITSSGTLAVTLASGYVIPTQTTLDGKVPYSGATGAVTLGAYSLTATGITVSKSAGISTITFPAGTNDPAYIQHEESTANLGIMRFSVGDDNDTNDYFVFGNTASGFVERFKITASGIVNLGTWQATAIADAYIASAATWNAKQSAITLTTTGTSGAATFTSNTLNIPNYSFTETDTLQTVILRNGTTNTGFTIENANSTYTNPSSTNVPIIYMHNTSTSLTAHAILSLRTMGPTGGNPFLSLDIDGVIGWHVGVDNADADTFKIGKSWSTVGNNTYLSITTSGNTTFGGTISATSAVFTQSAAASVNVNSTDTTSYSAFFFSENGTPKSYLEYINSAYTTTARRNYLEVFNNVGGVSLWTNSIKALDINTSQVATFTSNLGIGVTPSAWNSIYKVVEIGTAAIFGTSSYNSAAFSTNVFYNASNSPRYISTDFANMYWQDDGSHLWYNAASGTAGDAITFTTAMTLNASGNLGLGTTTLTNSTGYKTLSLNGSTGGQLAFQTADVGKAFIYSNSTDLRFYTNGGAFRFENTTGLEVGYATNQGAYKLDINGAGRFSGTLTVNGVSTLKSATRINDGTNGTSPKLIFGNEDESTLGFKGIYLETFWMYIQVHYNEGLRIKGTNGAGATQTCATFAGSSGNFTALGDVIAYSDSRLKTNINTIDNSLNKVLSMRGVSYYRTDVETDKKKIGLIAQEVAKVLPEVVTKNEDGMFSVAYGNIVGLLIEAIKEQQKQINELKNNN